MTDEIERLRAELAAAKALAKVHLELSERHAQQVVIARKERDAMRAALKPFAAQLKDNYSHQIDELPIIAGSNQTDIRFRWTLGDFRRARAALKETKE